LSQSCQETDIADLIIRNKKFLQIFAILQPADAFDTLLLGFQRGQFQQIRLQKVSVLRWEDIECATYHRPQIQIRKIDFPVLYRCRNRYKIRLAVHFPVIDDELYLIRAGIIRRKRRVRTAGIRQYRIARLRSERPLIGQRVTVLIVASASVKPYRIARIDSLIFSGICNRGIVILTVRVVRVHLPVAIVVFAIIAYFFCPGINSRVAVIAIP